MIIAETAASIKPINRLITRLAGGLLVLAMLVEAWATLAVVVGLAVAWVEVAEAGTWGWLVLIMFGLPGVKARLHFQPSAVRLYD